MTELASMAAYKNTNNNSTNNTSTSTTAQTSSVQPHSPARSSTSSLVSPDSSATNPISSPEGGQTPQNKPLPSSSLMMVQAKIDESMHDDLSTPTNQAPAIDNNSKFSTEPNDSPIIDTKSCGSVLDKASMFEKKLE